MNDRESELARGIARRLDSSLGTIDPATLERLRSAREIAVAALARRPALALVASGTISSGRPGVLQYLAPRYVVPAAALLLAIIGTAYLQQPQNDDIADVDAKLLSGDLPIDAYLDKGLDSWLKRTSH